VGVFEVSPSKSGRPKQRVINARGLVFVDGYAVPKTELGQLFLNYAIQEDIRNGYVPVGLKTEEE